MHDVVKYDVADIGVIRAFSYYQRRHKKMCQPLIVIIIVELRVIKVGACEGIAWHFVK